MGKIIPAKIKRDVINDWLNGLSRDDIATKNHIARGSVSNIICAVKAQEIPDIDLLRVVAVELKREGLNLTILARSIRLRKMFDKQHISEEKVEKLLEYLPIFFYRNDDRNIETFCKQLELVYELTYDLDIPLFEMPVEIDILKKEIMDLNSQKSELEKQVEQKRSHYQKITDALHDIGWRRIPPQGWNA